MEVGTVGGVVRALVWSGASWGATSLWLYRNLYPRLSVCEWAGVSLGWAFASILSYVAVLGGGFGNASGASLALLGCALFFALWFVQGFVSVLQDSQQETKKNGISSLFERLWKELREMWILQLLTLASLIYFARCFDYHVLMKTQWGEHWAYGSVYGDLPFHLGIITSFLYGENSVFPHSTSSVTGSSFSSILLSIRQAWLPKSHIFSGEQLVYPFIPDFHAALLTFFVGDANQIRNAIIYPSVVLVTSFIVLLYSFNLRLFEQKRYVAALIAVLLTMLSVGLGGFEYFKGSMTWHDLSKFDWAQSTETIGDIYWFHLVCHILLPQRSTLFAYPIALIVLSLWHSIFYADHTIGDNARRMSFFQDHKYALIAAIFATGLLPLLQPHSLVALAVFCASLLLFKFPYRSVFKWMRGSAPLEQMELVWIQLIFAVGVAIVSFPQLVLAGYFSRIAQKQPGKEGFIRVEPIWKIMKQGAMPIQWTISLSLFPWMSLLGLLSFGGIKLRGRNEKLHGAFVGAAWMIFLFANFVILQPWERDNTKVFYIWMFAAASSAALFVAKLWSPPYRGLHLSRRFLATAFVGSMILTGSLMLLRDEQMGGALWDDDAVKLANWVKANTDRNAVIYTDPMSHAHTVHALAGRSAFLGYLGWLDSHGHSADKRWVMLNDLFSKDIPKERFVKLARSWSLSYILVSNSWSSGEYWTPDASAMASKSQLVYKADGYQLYDLRNVPKHPKHIEEYYAPPDTGRREDDNDEEDGENDDNNDNDFDEEDEVVVIDVDSTMDIIDVDRTSVVASDEPPTQR